MPRTKDTAAANEDADIKCIIDSITKNTPRGQLIKETFKKAFGIEIIDARPRKGRKGSRSTHHDLVIILSTNEEKQVEHKGSISQASRDDTNKPWRIGVQFFNGPCDKFSICKVYAKKWYEIHISSGSLKEEFQLISPIPSFEEWFTNDCKPQGNPKTAFGKELKTKVRALRGDKASLLEKRKVVNDALDFTEEDIETLKREMLSIANSVLSEKHYWLNIHGELASEFTCAWYPQYLISNIVSVEVEKADKDITFTFETEDGSSFGGILRWGKGAGFSNLRLDAK